MVRKKKLEVKDNTGATEAFLSRCFSGEVCKSIQPTFGEEYSINGSMYSFTEEVLDEMMATGTVKITYQTEKVVNIVGVL